MVSNSRHGLPAASCVSLGRGCGRGQGHRAAASRGGAQRQGRGGHGSPQRPLTAEKHWMLTHHPHVCGFKVLLYDFLSCTCTHVMTITNFAGKHEALNKQSAGAQS